jgi:hypothetical protein
MAYGTSKNGRDFLSKESVGQIKVHTEMQKGESEGDYWELCAVIPFQLLNTDKESLTRQPSRVNFFKCGDDLPVPHFLSWNNIEAPEPDFHVPEFFGFANFITASPGF